MTLAEDLDADGEPEREFHRGIAQRLHRKRVAAGALIRDDTGRILFVVPAYKPGLDIPGGVAERDEPPLAAQLRHTDDELLGLKILPLEQAAPLLRPSMVRRMEAALDAIADGEPRYLEFGRAP